MLDPFRQEILKPVHYEEMRIPLNKIITFIPDEELIENVQPRLTYDEALRRIEASPMHESLRKYLESKLEEK